MDQFAVFYTDGTQFIGSPFKSDWKRLDSTKKITKFQYKLGNFCITLKGYKQYNHLLECVGLGRKGINKIFLMGRTEGDTDVIVLDLRKKTIIKDIKPCYKEYGQQILNGWQEGELDTPKATYKQIKNV